MRKKTIETAVMSQIINGEINMKPRWYFILGSVLLGIGLIGLSIGAIFLINLSFFLLRQHGPMGEWRLQLMLETFPWWIPILALLGISTGIYFLKKFDFSYKKNFLFIVISFVATIIFAAFIVDYSGINDTWFRQGRMRRLYQQNQQINQHNSTQFKNFTY